MFHPLWLSPLVISYGLNTIRKFTEHLGMGSFDPVQGTRTVIGPGLVTRISSYFNFDIYVHGPHHRYPKAQHYELPQKLAEPEAANFLVGQDFRGEAAALPGAGAGGWHGGAPGRPPARTPELPQPGRMDQATELRIGASLSDLRHCGDKGGARADSVDHHRVWPQAGAAPS